MTKKGYNVFVAYADPKANERGTIYQSLGWSFCGFTNPTEKFRRPDGKVYDARNVHLLTRDRRFGKLRYKRTRAEQKQATHFRRLRILQRRSAEICGMSAFMAIRRTKRILRAALSWEFCRTRSESRHLKIAFKPVDLDPLAKTFAASVS